MRFFEKMFGDSRQEEIKKDIKDAEGNLVSHINEAENTVHLSEAGKKVLESDGIEISRLSRAELHARELEQLSINNKQKKKPNLLQTAKKIKEGQTSIVPPESE